MWDPKTLLEPNIPPDPPQSIRVEFTQAEIEQRRAEQAQRMNSLPEDSPVRQLYERLRALAPE
jgi:hypothetical protein